MRTILFLVIFFAVLFTGCTPDSPVEGKGNLEIIFKARYNNSPLVLFQSTPTGIANPTAINFKKFDFFISDIKGKNNASKNVDFATVGYISMENSLSTASSEIGTTFSIADIPVGTYNELNMGIGVPDATNNKSPGDYPSSSPLGLNSNYWASWTSYVFSKFEGDITQSNSAVSAFICHSGVNGMYQLCSFAKNFKISDGQTTQLVIHINAEDIFFKTGNEVDIINEPTIHSGAVNSTKYNLSKKSIENLATSLVLE